MDSLRRDETIQIDRQYSSIQSLESDRFRGERLLQSKRMGVDEVLAFASIPFAAFVCRIILEHDLDFEIAPPMAISFVSLSGIRLDFAIVATRSDLNILGLLHHLNAEPVR